MCTYKIARQNLIFLYFHIFLKVYIINYHYEFFKLNFTETIFLIYNTPIMKRIDSECIVLLIYALSYNPDYLVCVFKLLFQMYKIIIVRRFWQTAFLGIMSYDLRYIFYEASLFPRHLGAFFLLDDILSKIFIIKFEGIFLSEFFLTVFRRKKLYNI